MVDVAQLVEPRIVIPAVVGSSPIVHPIFVEDRAPCHDFDDQNKKRGFCFAPECSEALSFRDPSMGPIGARSMMHILI